MSILFNITKIVYLHVWYIGIISLHIVEPIMMLWELSVGW